MAILFRILFTLGLLTLHVSVLSAQAVVTRDVTEIPLKFVSEHPTHILASTLKSAPTYLNCQVFLNISRTLNFDLLTTKFYHEPEPIEDDDDDDPAEQHDKEEIIRRYNLQSEQHKRNRTLSNPQTLAITNVHRAHSRRRIARSAGGKFAFEWRKDDKTVASSKSGESSVEGFTLYPNGTLKFQASNLTAGEYRCLAKYNDNSGKYSIGPILSTATVVEIANWTNDSSERRNFTVAELDSIVIVCPIVSVPAANFTWEFKNNEINFDVERSKQRHFLLSNGSLLIVNSQIADSGKYRCNATNQFTKRQLRSSSLMLSVLSRSHDNYNHQSGLLSKLQSSIQRIQSGQSLVLHCASHTDKILWTFTPRIGNIPINLTNVNNELKYVNVSVTKHDGIYNCSTENDFQEFDVTIVTPPVFIAPAKSIETIMAATVKFNCSVSGNPKPVVEWYKNGVKIPNNHVKYFEYPIAKIETIDPDDEGIYQCLARNDFGEISNTFYLHVTPKPIMDKKPQNVKCTPMDNNLVQVTFDRDVPSSSVHYFIASDSPRDFLPQLALNPVHSLETTSFTIDTSKARIFKPLKPFHLYMRNMQHIDKTMIISQISKPIICATQGIEPKFVKTPNGIFLRWDLPEAENITGYTIQFLNNKTSSPVAFTDEVVGTYEKLPTYVSWNDVSKMTLKVPARNHRKDDLAEVQLSGNVTGLYIPNVHEIEVRILGTVQENGELLEQNLDLLKWWTIKASSISFHLLEVAEANSREAKLVWKELDDVSCARICSRLKTEIISRDPAGNLKCEKIQPSAKYFYLQKLLPSSDYDAFITDCDNNVISTGINFQTKGDVPTPVTKAQITIDNGIILHWKPPQPSNGEIFHYHLEWTFKNVTYKKNVTGLSFKFPNTTNTDQFNITVQALGVAGLGTPLIINPSKWNILPTNILGSAERQDTTNYLDSFMVFSIALISLALVVLLVVYVVCRRHRYCKNSNGIINSEQSSFPPTTSPLTENIRDEMYEMQTLIPATQLVVANGLRPDAPSNGGIGITENQKILRTSTPTDESIDQMCIELPAIKDEESLAIQIEDSKAANNFPEHKDSTKNGTLKANGNLSPFKCFQSPGNDQNSSGSSSFDSHRQLIDPNLCNGFNNNNVSERSKIGKSSSIETDNEEEDSEENLHEYDLNDSNLSSKPLHPMNWNFRRPLVGPNG